MKSIVLTASLSLLVLAGCISDPAGPTAGNSSGFRVRSDFAAGLNANQGWAGAVNEGVAITADQPFRIRFEVEPPPGSSAATSYQLQYRRNGGEWTSVEAHDFPYPVRELALDFEALAVGASPQGWRMVQGNAGRMAVAADGSDRFLRVQATQETLVGLYSPPWSANEFAAEFRLTAGSRSGLGFVFGHDGTGNYGRVFVDPAAGVIRLSRFARGMETVVAERSAVITPGQWLEIEIQTEAGEVEVNFGDGTVEFSAALGANIPSADFGVEVPSGGRAEFREFVVAGESRTPRVSIVSSPAYENGAATTNLLPGSTAAFQAGAGIALAEQARASAGADAHSEFEWALVIRRLADGAVTSEEGDVFDLRMVGTGGNASVTSRTASLRLTIPPGHLGGTYVETPGEIGPWQAANGDLYFIMEPTETHNVFMMVKSTDGGRTWREVDSANRPLTDDLESVDARRIGHTIHIIHQITNSTHYHSFRTSDHPTEPDTWAVRDEVAATAVSVAQAATMVVRSDGSIVTFYVADTVHYNIRAPGGGWGADTPLDPGLAPKSAGPKAVLGANDVVHLAYYGMDGTVWYRQLRRDGSLTPRQQLASGLGATRAEYGAVLPLVFLPQSNTVVILYRQADGRLWERRIVGDGPPTPAVRVTDRAVSQHPVDSQQAVADAYPDEDTIRVLFVDEATRSIFSTSDRGGWQPPQLQVGNIQGSWVRGTIYTRRDGTKVYGYVYDAGSRGGAGLNRFKEWVLTGP